MADTTSILTPALPVTAERVQALPVLHQSAQPASDGSDTRRWGWLTGAILPTVLLALWEGLARVGVLPPNLLPEFSLAKTEAVVTSANTGGDLLTSNHIRNWMECVRSRRQPHAPVEAGYSHSIATIMTNAAVHSGMKATFDEKNQEVMVGGKVFKY